MFCIVKKCSLTKEREREREREGGGETLFISLDFFRLINLPLLAQLVVRCENTRSYQTSLIVSQLYHYITQLHWNI